MLERAAKDRLSQSEYRVGYFYARFNVCVGAVDRFRRILVSDPAFTGRDGVYFHMGECLLKMGAPAEALPWYERLTAEFQKSEFLERAKKRVLELKKAKPGLDPLSGGPGPWTLDRWTHWPLNAAIVVTRRNQRRDRRHPQRHLPHHKEPSHVALAENQHQDRHDLRHEFDLAQR